VSSAGEDGGSASVLKATGRTGATHLVWARPDEIVAWGEEMQEFLKDAPEKYLIPVRDYPRYLNL